MIKGFGREHGEVLDRVVRVEGRTATVIAEIVTVNYHDGSRPSTAIMHDVSFTLEEGEDGLKLVERNLSAMPVVIDQTGEPGTMEVTLSEQKVVALVKVGPDVALAGPVVEAYKPTMSDSRQH